MSEENFPRGGGPSSKPTTKPLQQQQKRKHEEEEEFDDLFGKPKVKKMKIPKVVKPEVDEQKLFSEIVTVGTIVLGCIREVHDFELVVSLPSYLKGFIPITGICDAYTLLLQKLAKGNESDLAEDESLLSLHDIFNVGDVVRCRVTEVTKKGYKKTVQLSLNPKEVNSNITSLKNGLILTGCVSSCEDHGYVVDLGLKRTTAFLKKEDAEKYIKDIWNGHKKLSVGSYFHCKILSDMDGNTDEENVVNVVIDPKIIHDSLVENGGAVLFVNPLTKVALMTQSNHLVSPNLVPTKLFGNLAVGNVIEEAEVKYIEKKRGVHFKLPNNVNGFANFSKFETKDLNEIHRLFTKGSKHRCRIVHFDYLTKVAFLSLKKHIIDLEFFSYSDIKPGMLLECTADKLSDYGLSVRVNQYIRGFLPKIQLSDVPLTKLEKKFSFGKELKCKVLSVDVEKPRLVLTFKKSLVRSKLPTITDFDECKKGLITEGFIASVKLNGILVVFYNDVKGWVPKKELSYEEIDDPRSLFFVGQVVKCRVLFCNNDERKLFLSLKISPSASGITLQIPEDIVVGKILQGCVVGKVESNGLTVRLPQGVSAILPKMHLSDYKSNVQQLLNMFTTGALLEDVMIFDKNKWNIILTKKSSVVHFSQEGHLVNEFSMLKPGMILPGVVKKKMPYGLFINIIGLTGLVPMKYLVDKFHPDPLSFFDEGQSVMTKVTEVDIEKERFLLSLRVSDCYHGNSEVGLDLLENYLEENQRILDHYKTKEGLKSVIGHLTIGQLVVVTILEANDKGVLCLLREGVKGFATLDNMSGVVCKVGEEQNAVILCIDTSADCVQLSLNKEFVKIIQKFDDDKFSKARVGQVIKSEVQLVTDDYVLVYLKGHARGRLAFLPSKRHLNDVVEKFLYHVGQVNPVSIKRVTNNGILASLQIHEVDSVITKTVMQYGRTSLPEVGTIVTARVLKVYPMQMNVIIDGIPGRIFITEIVDDLEMGSNPLNPYSEGMKLTVKVIGFREEKTHKYLPITRASMGRVFLECSLKPSKLSSTSVENLLQSTMKSGERVIGFVTSIGKTCINMQITQTLKGTVHVLNASNNPKVLKKLSKHFKVGKGYRAKVIDNAEGEHGMELTIADRSGEIKIGDIVPGLILKTITHRGLLLQLPHHQIGDVHLTNVSDEYEDLTELKLPQENSFVLCRILYCCPGPRIKWNVSLRKSHVSAGKTKKTKKAKITDCVNYDSNDPKEGDVCRGYIVGNGKSGVLISVSPEITGRVKHGHLSKYFIHDLKSVFYLGKVVTAKILRSELESKHFDLSLLERDTGVPEAIPEKMIKNLRLKIAKEEAEVQAVVDKQKSDSSGKPFLCLFSSRAAKKQKISDDQECRLQTCDAFWSETQSVLPSAAHSDDSDNSSDDLTSTNKEQTDAVL